MRVAISGASGFVGTRLVAKLLAGGNDVVVLTRDVEKARAALRSRCLTAEAELEARAELLAQLRTQPTAPSYYPGSRARRAAVAARYGAD